MREQIAPVLNQVFSELSSPLEDVTWDVGYALIPSGPDEIQAYGMLNLAMRSKVAGAPSVNLTALLDLRQLRDEGDVKLLAFRQMEELRRLASKQLDEELARAKLAAMPQSDPRSIPEFDFSKITKTN